jgi:hypothetical protein
LVVKHEGWNSRVCVRLWYMPKDQS